jgi:hypothetical protein
MSEFCHWYNGGPGARRGAQHCAANQYARRGMILVISLLAIAMARRTSLTRCSSTLGSHNSLDNSLI